MNKKGDWADCEPGLSDSRECRGVARDPAMGVQALDGGPRPPSRDPALHTQSPPASCAGAHFLLGDSTGEVKEREKGKRKSQ